MDSIQHEKPEEVVKEAFWIAWQKCDGLLGMGILQNNPFATKEKVWENIACSGDYPGGSFNKPGKLIADYVFGRMMKLSLEYDENEVRFHEGELDIEYQAWSKNYANVRQLVEEAIQNINTSVN